MTERQRILATLRGEQSDLPAWATRLDLWLASCPDPEGRPVPEIHRALGVGRQSYVDVFRLRLRGVELVGELDGAVFLREGDALVRFPLVYDLVPRTRPGLSTFTFRTPVGSATLSFATNETILATGSLPYIRKHPVTDGDEMRVVCWILDRCEVVPWYGAFRARERETGDDGITIGTMDRVPFQRILLDFVGEVGTFYLINDDPSGFRALLDRLEDVAERTLQAGLDSPADMVELVDNFDGEITNPALFARYCLPHLQHARELAHGAGKRLGSHMDGDMSALAALVVEDCLDVVESFSPEPLSRLRFRDAWELWRGKVVPWGCLASPLFEPQTPPEVFERETADVIAVAREEGGLILGIADQAVERTLPGRVRRVRELIEG